MLELGNSEHNDNIRLIQTSHKTYVRYVEKKLSML